MALSKITNASFADTAVHGRRNIIINGAMQIAQRATSKTAQTADAIHTVDRFFLETSGATFDIAQVSDAPDGFQYSQKVTMSGAFTPTASQYFIPFEQRIEKQNLTHLAYGTSNAKSVTLSFWIKSNKTGTYVVEFSNNPNSRKWSQSYTVDTADTWEHKTLTWTGDTASDFGSGNGSGGTFFWWMTAGTTFTSGALSGGWEAQTNANRAVGVPSSLADDDEFYLTGVQLEVGDKATPFEHRSYSDELQACQRYFCKSYAMDKYAGATDDNDNQCTLARINSTVSNRTIENAKFPVRMRTKPTVTVYSLNGTSGSISDTGTNAGTHTRDEVVTINKYGETGIAWFSSVNSFTAGDGGAFHFTADAEL